MKIISQIGEKKMQLIFKFTLLILFLGIHTFPDNCDESTLEVIHKTREVISNSNPAMDSLLGVVFSANWRIISKSKHTFSFIDSLSYKTMFLGHSKCDSCILILDFVYKDKEITLSNYCFIIDAQIDIVRQNVGKTFHLCNSEKEYRFKLSDFTPKKE